MLMKEIHIAKDEWLWKKDELCPGCYFVWSGGYNLVDMPPTVKGLLEFTYKGNLIGDFPSLTGDRVSLSSCRCSDAGEVYFIDKNGLKEFFSRNPGIFVQFADQYIIT